ncbi:MAG: peptidoglycan editing factor PgeF [Chloroflexi bacterium]|nr:peptidoglycan editing factor PgeF [Chloroflexota bacterium]
MPFIEKNGLKFLTLPSFESEGITHGFFTRQGGVSPQPWQTLNVATSVGDSRENVIENRNRILSTFGMRYDSVFDTWQVHSDIVHHSENPRPVDQPHKKGDAIITSNPKVALMMVFADCVPILFYDTEKKIIAIAHAGWQGTVKHIASRTVEKMQEVYGSRPRQIIAGIGPSIGIDHYEIGESTAQSVRISFREKQEAVLQERERGHFHFDMWKANSILLEQMGLKNIEVAGICTACDMQHWYSHRGEQGNTGRFAAVITLPV